MFSILGMTLHSSSLNLVCSGLACLVQSLFEATKMRRISESIGQVLLRSYLTQVLLWPCREQGIFSTQTPSLLFQIWLRWERLKKLARGDAWLCCQKSW